MIREGINKNEYRRFLYKCRSVTFLLLKIYCSFLLVKEFPLPMIQSFFVLKSRQKKFSHSKSHKVNESLK